MKYVFFALFVVAVIYACSGSDDDDCPDFGRLSIAPEGIFIDLRDLDDNPLLGTAFVKDSFKVYNESFENYIYPIDQGDFDILFIWFSAIESNDIYYLELNENDTDTLKIGYSLREGKCFDRLGLDQFIYNNQVLYDGEEIEPGYYIVTKE